MHQGVDEVFVHHARFVIPRVPFFHLLFEPFLLVQGIVQFGKAVAQFPAEDVPFETVGDFRIRRAALGQRGDFLGMAGDENGLDQVLFHEFIEESVDDLAHTPGGFHCHAGLPGQLPGRFHVLHPGEVLAAVFLHSVDHGHPGPGTGQVDFRAFILDFQGPQDLFRTGGDDLFRQVHHGVEIPEGFIAFQGGEFRVVFDVHPFVPEHPAQFVHPFQTPYHQTLQVQFRGDPQVQIDVQGIVMGNEGPCGGAPGNGVQHRSLHFQVALVVQHLPDAFDDLGPFHEHVPDFRVHDQIHIPLTVADFLILQPMPFFRQGFQGLGEEFQFLDPDGGFSHVGLEDRAFHPHDVPDIQQFHHAVGIFAHFVLPDVQLDLACLVLEIHETGLAMAPDGQETAGHFHHGACGFHGFHLVVDLFGVVGPLVGMAERPDALFFQFMHFVQTDLHLLADVFVRQGFLLYVRLVLLFVGHEIPPALSVFEIIWRPCRRLSSCCRDGLPPRSCNPVRRWGW